MAHLDLPTKHSSTSPDTAYSAQDDNRNLTSAGYTAGSDGASVGFGTTAAQGGSNPGLLSPDSNSTQDDYTVGRGMDTEDAESLGGTGGEFNQMKLSRSRKLLLPLRACSESRIQP